MMATNSIISTEKIEHKWTYNVYKAPKIIHSVLSLFHRYGEGSIRTKVIESIPQMDILENAVQVFRYCALL